jgi:hypothetical protein
VATTDYKDNAPPSKHFSAALFYLLILQVAVVMALAVASASPDLATDFEPQIQLYGLRSV